MGKRVLRTGELPGGGPRATAIAAAAFITVLDGFDALCLPLVAPQLRAELHLSAVELGFVFSSTLAGTIVGAAVGGLLADKFGRLRILVLACMVFGGAALLMPFVSSGAEVIANRVIAGAGLGAAAPIAIGLLVRSSAKPPSDLVISMVWMGIGAGGVLAALFNYMFIPAWGWRSVFVAGGVLPFLAAAFAIAVFRHDPVARASPTQQRSSVVALLSAERLPVTLLTAAMFFFGYIVSAVTLNWLPTLLVQRSASALLVSSTFSLINAGALIATLCLGFFSSRTRSPRVLAVAWFAAGALMIGAGSSSSTMLLATLAVCGAVLATGAQAVSVAFASRIHRDSGLESTTIGLMVCAGRIGQVGALVLSGALIQNGLRESAVFLVSGVAACSAGGLGYVAITRLNAQTRRSRETSARLSPTTAIARPVP